MLDALWKSGGEIAIVSEFLGKQVDLVENNNVRHVLEPAIVPKAFEDLQ